MPAAAVQRLLDGRRLVVVSNREPFTVVDEQGKPRFTPTVGGLVSALDPVMRATKGEWIAWKRGVSGERAELATSPKTGGPYTLRVIPVSEREAGGYYDGFANRALWPLFHGFTGRARFADEEFEAYRRVNARFAEAVAESTRARDVVWIHDYQLMLVPSELSRRVGDRARIGYFHHIPFPALEIFRALPWAREVLRGLLGAALVGFHTESYRENFLHACEKLLGAPVDRESSRVHFAGRWTRVGVFPIGIDVAHFEETAASADAIAAAAKLRRDFRGEIIGIGVDRLDYTKGIRERILAVETFFERHPSWKRRVSFVQIAVPSRTRVEEYRQMKRELDETVGRVNGRFTEPGWTPVRYITRGLDHARLVPLYMAADFALITPLRDGMNLVAMEYVASRVDGGGSLILSDQAGAAEQLEGAWLVNPRHLRGVADTIAEVLETPAWERSERMATMRERVREGDVHRWMESFLAEALRD